MDDEFKGLRGKLLSGRVYPEFFPLDSSDRVVNLGCGEGPQAIVYAGTFGEMVGVDIQVEKLQRAEAALQVWGVHNVTLLQANVERTNLDEGSFDKALAIDVVEHVEDPRRFCLEVARLLKPGGEVLLTFPTLHDKYIHLGSSVGRLLLRKKRKPAAGLGWDPSVHNQEHSVRDWIALVESCGLELWKSRASTLFPPLHAYGVPRFWFSSNLIHRVDSVFCRMPVLRNYGQALLCVFRTRA